LTVFKPAPKYKGASTRKNVYPRHGDLQRFRSGAMHLRPTSSH
jgi:hypothetical protein